MEGENHIMQMIGTMNMAKKTHILMAQGKKAFLIHVMVLLGFL